MADCIFCSIIAGDIPCSKVYEDDNVIAFNDIRPIKDIHVLVMPKAHFDKLHESDESHTEMLGQLMVAAGKVAAITGADKLGYQLLSNQGKSVGQTVFHLHTHLTAGKRVSR